MPETRVEMWFDPTCPWAWMTSRWLKNAQEVRDIEVTFSVMSLSVLNQGRDLDPDYRRAMDQAWGPVRVAIAVEQAGGKAALDAYYTAFGEAFHVHGDRDPISVMQKAVSAAGVDVPVAQVSASDELDDALRASHQRAIDLVGNDVGTPVISFGEGTAYFGPVVSPAPRGEDAGRLLDGLRMMSAVPGFFELKRSRTVGPILD
ncbi:DsbA family protein [Devriesea agamarum]|uniref:DsbA family protein n=1 Tax=Devriesea agamarum TaxID=472569 RepID=UPI00071E040A|nr:DsbA family protein [Devriesea agamarum]